MVGKNNGPNLLHSTNFINTIELQEDQLFDKFTNIIYSEENVL